MFVPSTLDHTHRPRSEQRGRPTLVPAPPLFRASVWNYYRQLLAYKQRPTPETALELRCLFHQLLTTPTDYWELEKRKHLTREKESELLLVLEHPELPLHNNPA